jgi:PAS domain S-box-containing protein
VPGPPLAPVGVALLDAHGTLRSVNAELPALVARSASWLVGRPLGEALGSPEWEGLAPGGQRELRVTVDGRERWLRVTLASAPPGAVPSDGLVAMLEDVSERRRLEEEERARPEQLQRAVAEMLSRASPLGEQMLELLCHELGWEMGRLWLASRACELRFMQVWIQPDAGLQNEAAAARRSREAPPGSPTARAWLSRQPVWHMEPRAAEGEREPRLLTGLAFPMVLDDEVLGVVDLWSRTRRAAQPQSLALVASVGRQIAQFIARKRVQAALRGSQKQLTSIIDNTPALIFLTHIDGRVLRLNSSAERALGIARSEIVGRPFRNVLPEAIAAPLGRRIDEALSDEAPAEAAECIERFPIRGEPRAYLAQQFALPDGTAQPYAVCSILTDITDRERAEHDRRLLAGQVAAAEDAARRKLARDIHDSIGQTLSAIKIDLGRALQEPGRHEELVATLSRGVGLVDEVIAQTRTLTFDLYPAMLDDLGLVPTLQSYVEGFGASARVRGSVTESGRRREPATALRNYLFRAVKELLNNVRKHANATQVLVAVRFTDTRIRVLVADDGRGFDAELALAPERRTGLGLADMRQHVAFLGGEVHIDATAGHGTQVIIELPLEERQDG